MRRAKAATPCLTPMSEVRQGCDAPDTYSSKYVGSAAWRQRSRHPHPPICRKCGEVATLPTPTAPNMSEVRRGRDAYDKLGLRVSEARRGMAQSARPMPRAKKVAPGTAKLAQGRRAKGAERSEAHHLPHARPWDNVWAGLPSFPERHPRSAERRERGQARPRTRSSAAQPTRWGLHPRSYPSRSTRCRCPRPRSWSGSSARRRCTAPHGWCSQHWTPRT